MSATKRTAQNVVFVFGAGASAAISPEKIPCMGDYFEKWVMLTETEGGTQYWLPLACIEEARVFPPNPEAESWATRIRTIGGEIQSFKEKRLSTTELEGTQSTYLKSYIHCFKKDSGRMRANLEKILTILEQSEGDDAEDARARLLMSIHTFFSALNEDQGVVKKFTQGPHQKLAEFLKERRDLNVTFISFNYDLWLEKALQKNRLWNPGSGYGHPFLYAEPHKGATATGSWGHYDAKPFEKLPPSKVSVLKPNGSLSWFFSSKKNEPVVLTADGEETGEVSYNKDFYLERMNIGNAVGWMLAPLIVPPIPTANRRYPVFWSIDKKIQACLQEADVLVIIGWSLPDTDQKFAEDFKRAINARNSQLPSLVLCDTSLHQNNSRSQFIHKFESLFRPANPAIVREANEEDGFTEDFIQFLGSVLNS